MMTSLLIIKKGLFVMNQKKDNKIKRIFLVSILSIVILTIVTVTVFYLSSTAIFRNKTIILPENQYISFCDGDMLTISLGFMDSASFFCKGDIEKESYYFIDENGKKISGSYGYIRLSKEKTLFSPYSIYGFSATIDTSGLDTTIIKKVVINGKEFAVDYLKLDKVEEIDDRAESLLKGSIMSTIDHTTFRASLYNVGDEEIYFEKIEFELENELYSYGIEPLRLYKEEDTELFIDFEDKLGMTGLRPRMYCTSGGSEFIVLPGEVTRYDDIRYYINDERIIEIIKEREKEKND